MSVFSGLKYLAFNKQNVLVLAVIIFTASWIFLPAQTVKAQDTGELCSGANLDLGNTKKSCKTQDGKVGGKLCKNSEGDPVACSDDSLNNLITQIVNVFSIIVGVVAVIMIIYGGFRYVTSSGDSGNVENAKKTLVYAIVGLVIVALAQVIVKFVLNRVTS